MAGYKIQAKKTDGSLVDIPLAATYDDSGKKISEEYATQETVSDIIDGTTKVGKAGEADTATSADHATSADSATSAQSATKATQDSEGNSIIDTYVNKSELNDKAVLYNGAQTLTEEQQAQARANIDAASTDELAEKAAQEDLQKVISGATPVAKATNADNATNAQNAETAKEVVDYSDSGNFASTFADIQARLAALELQIAAEKEKKIYGASDIGTYTPDGLQRSDDAFWLPEVDKVSASEQGYSYYKSPFDNIYPWSEIHDVTDEFGNAFVEIPKFYHRITASGENGESPFKIQISKKKHEGFGTLFVNGNGQELPYIRVGKYEASGTTSRVYSKSGEYPIETLSYSQAQNACEANGNGYFLYDYTVHLIIAMLYWVEMKTTAMFCRGVDNLSAAVETGATDLIPYPTGYTSSQSTGAMRVKYRGMENLWGNVSSWMYRFSVSSWYDDTPIIGSLLINGYSVSAAGNSTEGYCRYMNLIPTNPFMFAPRFDIDHDEATNQDTYFCCRTTWGGAHNYYQDQAVVGGDYTYYDNSDDNYAALFTISSKHGSVNENYYSLGYTGARLCYKPSVDEE